MNKVILLITHGAIGFIGFAAGIYLLPIIIAPPGLTPTELEALAAKSVFTGEFRHDLGDSDFLHWGEGTVYVGESSIALRGSIAPGPAYKLYLSPVFVETEDDFLRTRDRMVPVGDVRTFENFVVPIPEEIHPDPYNTVVIWCESFGQFITAAKYR